MFVDDPRDSLQQAADLINTAIEESLAAIRRRQAVLASSWQERSADTEALRIALKDYRALWTVVRDMPVAGANGGADGPPRRRRQQLRRRPRHRRRRPERGEAASGQHAAGLRGHHDSPISSPRVPGGENRMGAQAA